MKIDVKGLLPFGLLNIFQDMDVFLSWMSQALYRKASRIFMMKFWTTKVFVSTTKQCRSNAVFQFTIRLSRFLSSISLTWLKKKNPLSTWKAETKRALKRMTHSMHNEVWHNIVLDQVHWLYSDSSPSRIITENKLRIQLDWRTLSCIKGGQISVSAIIAILVNPPIWWWTSLSPGGFFQRYSYSIVLLR